VVDKERVIEQARLTVETKKNNLKQALSRFSFALEEVMNARDEVQTSKWQLRKLLGEKDD